MAKIRVIRVQGTFNKNKPKVMFFHNNNFDDYTTKSYGKYNVTVVGKKQYDRFWDNKEKAYRATLRFHKG